MIDTSGPQQVTFTGVPRKNVLGVPVAAVTSEEFIARVVAAVREDRRAFITYVNAACSNIAADDAQYSGILSQADCVYADGQAIVWASRILSEVLPERVNAGDFIISFCEAAASRNLTVALLGGRPTVAEKAAAAWKHSVPRLQVVHTQDGFFSDGGVAAADAIAKANPDILLVGMGVPLQEKWTWENRDRLGVKVIWCVGALFEYYGEGRPRAPVWIRQAGLEWLFRLALEPRRLWRRYVIGNVRFVWRVFRAYLKQ